jgi:hypothetical protein
MKTVTVFSAFLCSNIPLRPCNFSGYWGQGQYILLFRVQILPFDITCYVTCYITPSPPAPPPTFNFVLFPFSYQLLAPLAFPIARKSLYEKTGTVTVFSAFLCSNIPLRPCNFSGYWGQGQYILLFRVQILPFDITCYVTCYITPSPPAPPPTFNFVLFPFSYQLLAPLAFPIARKSLYKCDIFP